MADRIETLMQKWEPAIRDAVLASFRKIRDGVSINRLTALIKAGDVEGAIKEIGLDPAQFRALDLTIERTFEAGGEDATAGIAVTRNPLGARIVPLFDIRSPRATAFIRTQVSDLVKQITDDQRLLIRAALQPLISGEDPLLTGQTPQKIALDLVGRISSITGHREGGIIGLTAEQAQWARNYEVSLGDVQSGVAPSADALTRKLRDRRFDRTVQKAIETDTPIPEETRQAMVAAYRNRTLRMRAENIALDQASTALHESQIEAWDQAIDRGAVTEANVRRFWITEGDSHVRPTHRLIPAMNEGGVGLHSVFITPKGPTMQPGWQFDPGCRCRVRVRVIEKAAQEAP